MTKAVVTFHLYTAVQYAPDSPPSFAELYATFDVEFGKRLVTISDNPRVSSQELEPDECKNHRGQEWRVAFENVTHAARLVATLTGSPAVAIVAEELLKSIEPKLSDAKARIEAVAIDGRPAQTTTSTSPKSPMASESTPGYISLLARRPLVSLLLFLLLASIWVPWSKFLETLIPAAERERPLTISVGYRIDRGTAPITPQVSNSQSQIVPRACRVRIQRGTERSECGLN